ANDLDFATISTEDNFKPRGDSHQEGSFYGYFEGNFKAIRNIHMINNPDRPGYYALFGNARTGHIQNLTVENIHIDTQGFATGGLIGEVEAPFLITNVHVSGVIKGGDQVGGLVGKSDDEIMER